MNGSIALVGSGEYLPQMMQLEQSLIDDGVKNGKQPVYVQIPTAAGQESSQRLEYWKNLGQAQADRLGITAKFLPIFKREDAFNLDFASAIENSALIYMSGGDPHYLAATLIDSPVWQAIYSNWNSGSSLAGCSAGAMVLSAEIPHFRLSRKEPTKGFNLLPNIRVIPHFDKFFKWIPDSAAKMMMQVPDGITLIGIDENTALIKRSDSISWNVSGQGKVRILNSNPEKKYSEGETVLNLPW